MDATTRHHATLVCRLTPPGEGGIGLLELAGPTAQSILERLFVSPRGIAVSALDAGRLLYGRLERAGERLDEIVLECVRPPDHYILNCHGGAVALQRVLRALEAEGARPGSWAELLRREQADGRLDAVQREAAERLPPAPTLRAVRALLDQHRGMLSAELRAIRQAVELDAAAAAAAMERLLATARYGRGLSDPLRLVIAGRPNVGKSTLGNALLRFDRLIVHPRPGTTRDTVEELFVIAGIPFLLVDTAGLRESADAVEREGVVRGRRELAQADAALLVFDASEPLQAEDLRLLDADLPGVVVPVLNKSDLPRRLADDAIRARTGRAPVPLSAATGEGLAELEARILDAVFPGLPAPGGPLLFTERQEHLLCQALDALSRRDTPRARAALTTILAG